MADVPTVPEGSTSYHAYSLVKNDGETPVDSVEGLEYKVTDGVTILEDWTSVDLLPTGTIEISATTNTIITGGSKKRYLTLRATHDSGDKITHEIQYKITDLKGVESI